MRIKKKINIHRRIKKFGCTVCTWIPFRKHALLSSEQCELSFNWFVEINTPFNLEKAISEVELSDQESSFSASASIVGICWDVSASVVLGDRCRVCGGSWSWKLGGKEEVNGASIWATGYWTYGWCRPWEDDCKPGRGAAVMKPIWWAYVYGGGPGVGVEVGPYICW
jgi:hypothetical protein